MKVTLEKDYRKYYTLEDLDHAKAVIACAKDDESKIAEYAEMTVNEVVKDGGDYCVEILKATAHTAKNCRAFDAYGEGTGNMDIWIEAVAETTSAFVKIGAYLSDIWMIGDGQYDCAGKFYKEIYVRQ